MEILTYNVPLWLVILTILVVVYFMYMTQHFGCFKKMGVKGPMPIPLFGNFIAQGRMGVMKSDEIWMKEYGKTWGIFDGKDPNLFVSDEETLSQLFVKKFANFPDRRTVEGFSGDMDHALTDLKGDHWKSVRSIMTPTFSAGKLKKMTPVVTKAVDVLVEQIKKKCSENKEVQMKTIYGGFTMDVISSTAFGIQTNSQENTDNDFVKNVSKLLDFNFTSPLLIVMFIAPFLLKPLNKIFGLSFMDKGVQQFFRKVVVTEINNRKTGREDYVDFMQLMIQAHDDNPGETKRGMNFKEILGNSVVFFFAGYETTATTLCMFSYNMALHPDIQEKVHQEITKELEDEEPNYDNVQKLTYMEMCLNETLRLFPPATRVDRICTADTDLNGLKVTKGMIVTVPIWAIHRSADNWPNPETFDPERFSNENKSKHSPFHFLPFGYGPRNCIGMRLALLELKLALVKVIRQFKFSVGEKTVIPPTFSETGILSPKEVWLNVETR